MSNRTVSLVLGSGGARGLAHIGIIEYLEEQGFEIRSIAGSSIGALVGGVYAAGELPAYKTWVLALERTDVLRLLDLSFGWTGLFKGERIIGALRQLVGDRNIEDLPISFTAVATDVQYEKEVWLTRGPLFDAIRASIAIPTVFTPYLINGRPLLDGGLCNPVPIAPTLRDNTDLTIAVNLGAPPDALAAYCAQVASKSVATVAVQLKTERYHERIMSFIEELQETFVSSREEHWDFIDIITNSFETMQNTVARLKLAAYSPDITIDIPRDVARAFDFHRAAELIALGRTKAAEALARTPIAST